MQLMVSGVCVTHPQNVVPVSFKPRKSDLLKPVNNGLLLHRRNLVFRCK
jgi:hypothetical protein